jgi:predicted nucleic acid-binding Zn ribbon protein
MSDFQSRESGRLQIDPCEINLQIKRALPNVIRRQGIFFPEKECAQPIYE